MLITFLNDKVNIDKLKVDFKLDNNFLILLTKIMDKYPSMLDDINDSIHDIVSDKTIDTQDIPKILVLVKNVYKKFNTPNTSNTIHDISIEESINFIKQLLVLLIDLDHIKVNDKDSIIITLDLCVDLLMTSFDVTTSLFGTIKKCFRC